MMKRTISTLITITILLFLAIYIGFSSKKDTETISSHYHSKTSVRDALDSAMNYLKGKTGTDDIQITSLGLLSGKKRISIEDYPEGSPPIRIDGYLAEGFWKRNPIGGRVFYNFTESIKNDIKVSMKRGETPMFKDFDPPVSLHEPPIGAAQIPWQLMLELSPEWEFNFSP